MKIQINEVTRKKVEVEVDLPLYRQHESDCGSIVTYTKVEQTSGNLVAHSVTVSNFDVSLETKRNYRFDGSSADYLLGKGLYESSEAAFNQAVEAVKQQLAEIEGLES